MRKFHLRVFQVLTFYFVYQHIFQKFIPVFHLVCVCVVEGLGGTSSTTHKFGLPSHPHAHPATICPEYIGFAVLMQFLVILAKTSLHHLISVGKPCISQSIFRDLFTFCNVVCFQSAIQDINISRNPTKNICIATCSKHSSFTMNCGLEII